METEDSQHIASASASSAPALPGLSERVGVEQPEISSGRGSAHTAADQVGAQVERESTFNHPRLHLVADHDDAADVDRTSSLSIEHLYVELKRRGVLQVATSYTVIAWVIAQVAELVGEIFGVPAWILQALLIALAIGLPVALAVAWSFELTSEGLKWDDDISPPEPSARASGHGLIVAVIALLVLAVSTLLVSRTPLTCHAPVADESSTATSVPHGQFALYIPGKSTTIENERRNKQ